MTTTTVPAAAPTATPEADGPLGNSEQRTLTLAAPALGDLYGVVRISMPGTVGYREVIPRLRAFLATHPRLRVQVVLEDQRQDLIRDAVDVAIRLGKLTDASATSQVLISVPRVLLAARSYLDQAGVPASPEELAQHRIIGRPVGTVGWTFERDGQVVTIDLRPYLTVNDNEGMVVAAIAGLGICSTAMRTARPEVRDGSLVPLLVDWKRPEVDIHAYFPLGRGTRLAAPAGSPGPTGSSKSSPGSRR